MSDEQWLSLGEVMTRLRKAFPGWDDEKRKRWLGAQVGWNELDVRGGPQYLASDLESSIRCFKESSPDLEVEGDAASARHKICAMCKRRQCDPNCGNKFEHLPGDTGGY